MLLLAYQRVGGGSARRRPPRSTRPAIRPRPRALALADALAMVGSAADVNGEVGRGGAQGHRRRAVGRDVVAIRSTRCSDLGCPRARSACRGPQARRNDQRRSHAVAREADDQRHPPRHLEAVSDDPFRPGLLHRSAASSVVAVPIVRAGGSSASCARGRPATCRRSGVTPMRRGRPLDRRASVGRAPERHAARPGAASGDARWAHRSSGLLIELTE